jgi:flagellar biosynthesis/type III secretory pathway protein FliH
MSKRYLVSYQRKSQVAKYKNKNLCPVHSTIVWAPSAAKAKIKAGKDDRRINLTAKLLRDEVQPAETGLPEIFEEDAFAGVFSGIAEDLPVSQAQTSDAVNALFPDPDAEPLLTEDAPPALSEIDRAAEELLNKEDGDPDCDQDEALKDAAVADKRVDEAPEPPVVAIDVLVHNLSLSPDAVTRLKAWLSAGILGEIEAGNAKIEPLTEKERELVETGGSIVDANIAMAKYYAHEEGYEQGYDVGYDEGYELAKEDLSLGAAAYTVRLLAAFGGLVSAGVYALAASPLTRHLGLAVAIGAGFFAALVHFTARKA